MASDKAREILHRAYMQGYEEGRQAAFAERRQTQRRQVIAVLLERLSAGPQPARTMLALADELGVHVNTLNAAKVEAGVRSYRVRTGWVWVHPDHVATATQEHKITSQLALCT